MSGHEKEEWEKELGWIGLGWAELQCRWSDGGVGQPAGSRSYASTPTVIPDAKESKETATAWSDLTCQSDRSVPKLFEWTLCSSHNIIK